MKIRKVLLSITLLLCSITITGLAQEAQSGTTALPKNAKLIRIEYHDYSILGYVYKKQFVEGQKISINKGLQVISGTYFEKEGSSYVKVAFGENFIEGVLKVSNTYDGSLSPNPREARVRLSIEPVDIIRWTGSLSNSGYPAFLQKEMSNYVLTIKMKDSDLEVNITSDFKKNIFTAISNLFIYKNDSDGRFVMPYDFGEYIEKLEDVKLAYKNGDFFLGRVRYSKGEYRAVEGKYNFSSGEIFTGILNGDSPQMWSDNGEWKFIDGSVENGNWLKKYNVKEVDLESANTMTEKHSLAIQLYGQQQQAIMNETIAKQQTEERKRIDEQKRKQQYISKYGEYYGTLVSQRELRAGMSKAMVNDAYSKDYFIISESNLSGQSIEVWDFSKDKMSQAIMLEEAKNSSADEALTTAMAAMYLYELSKQMGGRTIPRRLIFKNNKLTDIYR